MLEKLIGLACAGGILYILFRERSKAIPITVSQPVPQTIPVQKVDGPSLPCPSYPSPRWHVQFSLN